MPQAYSRATFTRYLSQDEDSARWSRLPMREGDIVISTRSKSGTTWMQMICAQLVFQTAGLPAPLGEISPWLDHLVEPEQDALDRLQRQQHRRFVKTHTPLDGIPISAEATYIVVARHPLDMAVSLYHQGENIDRVRMSELIGGSPPAGPQLVRPSVHDWVLDWSTRERSPQEEMDGLAGVMWHLRGAWELRDRPNILLVHYDDLQADLIGQMRLLAERLGIHVSERAWPALVDAARFESMRADAANLAPGRNGVFKDMAAFFRRGSSGAGRELLGEQELTEYQRRTEQLAPADLLAWLHRHPPRAPGGADAP